jgi:hypothetical protein
MSRRISIADIYIFVESLKALPPGVRIGVIVPKEQIWCDEYSVKLAAIRGLHLKVCIDHETAKIWLLSKA